MSLVGKTIPRRLHKFTSFSIVTARLVTGTAFSADKNPPEADASGLSETHYFGRDPAVFDFQYRNRSRHSDKISRQSRTARIHDQRRAEAHDTLDVAMSLHDNIHRAAELPIHRPREHFVRRLVGSRNRVNQSDSHALDSHQMRLADALVRIEAEAMPVESLVAIAERCDHRRDCGQLVKHAIQVDVARLHHEIDSGEDLENPFREMLAGFGNMSVRDEADSHYALLRRRSGCRIPKPITHRNTSQFYDFDIGAPGFANSALP